MGDLITPEFFIGIGVALVGALGSISGAGFVRRSSRDAETTKRFELLFANQGTEIERLSKDLTELRDEFTKEQQLTEKLKEESSKWRALLQVALTYLRRLHHWESEGHPPPPPTMPPELTERLWEDL